MKIQECTKPIIVPWDFSKISHDALLRAVDMVNDPSLIRVVHVTQVPSTYEYGIVWDDISEESLAQQLGKSFRKDIESDSRLNDIGFTVLFGDPGRHICEFADQQDAELVILPSHGRSGIARVLLGSVAERVVRFAPCPVLVLRTAPED